MDIKLRMVFLYGEPGVWVKYPDGKMQYEYPTRLHADGEIAETDGKNHKEENHDSF